MSQLVQIWQTGVLDHRRRTTQDNKDVAGRSREVVLDHVTGHEPGAINPILRSRQKRETFNLNFVKKKKAPVLPLCWRDVAELTKQQQ